MMRPSGMFTLLRHFVGCAALCLCSLISFASAQTCVPPPAGLVSWWPGEGNAQDITGPNNGTLQGGTTFAASMVGQAFSLDGVDDFVAVPNAPSVNIGSGDFSLDAWVRTSIPDLQIIMDKRVGTLETPRLEYHFFVGLAGLGFQMADGKSETNFDSGVFIQDGTFHHVAVTVRRGSPDGGKIFVDGTVVLTFDPTPYAGDLDNMADFRIGASTVAGQYPHDSFQGLIDEMEFFKRALTDNEVQAIFNAGSAGKCKDAVGEVGGTVTGLRPARIVCRNLTTQQAVVIRDQDTSWNCETAGLEVTPGDIILINILGGAN
jgi:Concanavalin A-like lectin/glucanases superfamily